MHSWSGKVMEVEIKSKANQKQVRGELHISH